MAKSYLPIFAFLSLFSLLLIHKPLYAQKVNDESFFRDVYNQYRQKVEEYNLRHEDYLLKRAQYLNFKTLTAQENALASTKAMLQARDDVVIWYFRVLKESLKTSKGVSGSTIERLTSILDQEEAWFLGHRELLTSAATLEDLVKDSREAEERFRKNDPIIYEVLISRANGRVLDFTTRTDKIFEDIKAKLDEIRKDTREKYSFSFKKLALLDRWMLESQNLILRSKEKQSQIDGIILDLTKAKTRSEAEYDIAISTLTQSQLYLRDATVFLEEVIREIKTSE